MSIVCGDSLDVLKTYPDNHFSACVTDPPYGLSFMNKEWDHGLPDIEIWKEVKRTLKPGGFLLSMGGTRTFHRLTCSIEDAGFEIRDCIMWIYGSGFPKSHDISKAIDKRGGCPGLIDDISKSIKESRKSRNLSIKECDDKFCNSSTNWSWFEGRPAGTHLPSDSLFNKICDEWPELRKYFEKIKDLNREEIPTTGNLHKGTGNTVGCFKGTQKCDIPISVLSKTFLGFGTSLKPAYEPVIVAMKPLDGTFAQNAEKWGQAGINIDGCRVGTDDTRARSSKNALGILNDDGWTCKNMTVGSACGRWPANVIFDEEAGRLLDEQSGIEASRFFYCAKASASERGNDNKHPTVKPLKFMEYLIKLVMPSKGGILLDPFAGSGTTILAAKKLGLDSIGIEKNPEYAEIARSRIKSGDL